MNLTRADLEACIERATEWLRQRGKDPMVDGDVWTEAVIASERERIRRDLFPLLGYWPVAQQTLSTQATRT